MTFLKYLQKLSRFLPRAPLVTCALAALAPPALAEEVLSEGYIETFDDADYRDRWWFSNYESGGVHSATAWRRKMVSVVIPVVDHDALGGALTLELAPSNDDTARPFFGAEVQQGGGHHYGDYEVVMKAGKGAGTVTAFFTYTGPHFGAPHDEIDFEILGKDTTHVWINRFVDGERMPGLHLPLEFDAAAAAHLYRFEWRENSITWSVDGQEIHQVTDADMDIPTHAGKLFLSLWAGHEKQIAWLGEVDPEAQTTARFYCVSFRPLGDTGDNCSDEIELPR